MVELDCHLTKDGHVVICHDNSLERSSGVNKNISDLNFEVIFLYFLPKGNLKRVSYMLNPLLMIL